MPADSAFCVLSHVLPTDHGGGGRAAAGWKNRDPFTYPLKNVQRGPDAEGFHPVFVGWTNGGLWVDSLRTPQHAGIERDNHPPEMTMAAKRGRPKGPPIQKPGPKPVVLECPPEFVETIRKAEGLHYNCAEHRDPYKCAMALWRRAQGFPLRQVAAELGMTPGGIRRLQITHAKALDEQKRRFSAIYAQAASEYTE